MPESRDIEAKSEAERIAYLSTERRLDAHEHDGTFLLDTQQRKWLNACISYLHFGFILGIMNFLFGVFSKDLFDYT